MIDRLLSDGAVRRVFAPAACAALLLGALIGPRLLGVNTPGGVTPTAAPPALPTAAMRPTDCASPRDSDAVLACARRVQP